MEELEEKQTKAPAKKKAPAKIYKATDKVKCEINSPFRKKAIIILSGDVFNVLKAKGYANEID